MSSSIASPMPPSPAPRTPDALSLIERLAEDAPVVRVLSVGDGPGARALAQGLARNPLRPVLVTAGAAERRLAPPSAQAVAEAWLRFRDDPDRVPLDALLAQREAAGASTPSNPSASRPQDGFGLVLIENAGFTGLSALDAANQATILLLREPADSGAGWLMHQRLRADTGWVADDAWAEDAGWTVFRRIGPAADALPIHFFTIVLNGEPFIRHHERVFASLPFDWHWHIVEGVASLSHDTGWSLASGGRVLDGVHDRGRSNDGTSAYLDDLAARFPDRVTIHRKPPGEFWDGKREMVNAPLPHIARPGLLWQVDADELWTADQIATVHTLFQTNPKRTAAFYWCDYFVGPERIIGTRYNYAQNPKQEWLRTWRFEPGMRWAAHEPPTLVDAAGRNLAAIDPFTQDEMEEAGVVFQHFAYATEAQAAFKESYYGYKDARAHWRRLQTEVTGPALLRDYLPWVTDETMVDTAAARGVVPIAVPEGAAPEGAVPEGDGRGPWRFLDPAEVAAKRREITAAAVHPRILVDGLFYQHLSSGIARVWTAVLKAWVASGFADHVLLLDRAGTAPRIPGLHIRTIRAHDYAATGADSLYLEKVCREEGADLFVSTYYSTPTSTPSLFMGYDMIPETLGFPLEEETWHEKRRAIQHAAAHIMISRNSARDLERMFPIVPPDSTAVAYCGVGDAFRPADKSEVDAFRARNGIDRPYLLMVGERSGYQGYKNGLLLFRALALRPELARDLTVLCVGGAKEIEPAFRALAPSARIPRLRLNDDELRLAYAGAEALIYPSRYEGFGMPVVEAMACGCPVITCANSSIPEVAGDAALFVGEDDAAAMADAIAAARARDRRADLIARGLERAARFSFTTMADVMAKALTDATRKLADGTLPKPSPLWRELRTTQAAGAASVATEEEDDDSPWVLRRRLQHSEQQLRTVRNELTSMRNSPFWRLRGLTIGVLARLGVRWRR